MPSSSCQHWTNPTIGMAKRESGAQRKDDYWTKQFTTLKNSSPIEFILSYCIIAIVVPFSQTIPAPLYVCETMFSLSLLMVCGSISTFMLPPWFSADVYCLGSRGLWQWFGSQLRSGQWWVTRGVVWWYILFCCLYLSFCGFLPTLFYVFLDFL